ncbi:hypothetical protein C7448_101291 [Tenacibaculum gallaicum]|uniref:Uncharacterized protein n=1 Tax=Tenacibaculum gallaicum TaxID=561505 RepID=A0A3E0ICD7_9FLAO|nr:hypothetical protein [Tenacibaculum gallaicum]REH56253.1 hypothetical protein C7448_101291 [Tenacibaculum gallaicum]
MEVIQINLFYSKKVDLEFDFDFFYSIDSKYEDKDVLDAIDDLVTVNEIIDNYQINDKELPIFCILLDRILEELHIVFLLKVKIMVLFIYFIGMGVDYNLFVILLRS